MANSTATANIIVTANTQGAKSIVDLFNETKRGLDQTTNAHKHAAGAAKEHGLSIVDLAAKLYLVQVGIRNVLQVLERVYEFGKLGATVEQTAVSFERVITSSGQTVEMLNQLRASARGTASDVALMQMSNQALVGTTGEFKDAMAEALPMLLEMARASAILNPQLGSTEHQFDRLTLGLKRLEPRILDDIGLELRLTQVNREYADQIGKSVDALTVEERSFALLNAVLAKHNDYLKLAGDNAESAVDPYNRLEASAKNYANTLAKNASPAIEVFVTGLNELILALAPLQLGTEEISKAYEKHGQDVLKTSTSYADYNNEMRRAWETQIQGRIAMELAIGSARGLKEALDEQARGYQGLTLAQWNGYQSAVATEDEELRLIRARLSGLGVVKELTEEEQKLADKRTDMMSDLFLKELQINERRLDQQDRINTKIADEEERLREKIIDIHQDIEDQRTRITQDAAEERAQIEQNYLERSADLSKDILELQADLEGKNLFLSADTQAQLADLEAQSESVSNTLRRLRRDARRGEPREDRDQMIREAEDQQQLIEEQLSNIRKSAREEERRNRIEARIREKAEEILHLAEQKQIDLDAVTTKEQEKLRILAANEELMTRKATEESTKRIDAMRIEFTSIAEEADKNIRVATVDALLSVVPAGTKAAEGLMEMKLKMMGASDEMITSFHSVSESIYSEHGMNRMVDQFMRDGVNAFDILAGRAQSFSGQLNSLGGQVGQIINRWENRYDYMNRQHGGPMSAGHPYMVGEAGPEMVIPSTNSNVIPNDALGGSGGVVINITAGVFQGSQADARKFADWVAPLVMDYMSRYGGNPNAVGSRRIRSN